MEGENVFGNIITIGYPLAIPIGSQPSDQLGSPNKPRYNMQRRKMDDVSKSFGGQYQPTPGGIPTAAPIVQYVRPPTHQQVVGNPWQLQSHLQPMLGICNSQLMPFPPHHMQPMPTIIHTTCNAQHTNDILSINSLAAGPAVPSCLSNCRPTTMVTATAPLSSLWNYSTRFSAAPGGPVSISTAVSNNHRVLANISNTNSASQAVRGRPILGAQSVVINEVPASSKQFQHEFAKKQLKSESIMDWINKGTTNSSAEIIGNNKSEENISDVRKAVSGDAISSTSVSALDNSVDSVFTSDRSQPKCRSTSPLNRAVGSKTIRQCTQSSNSNTNSFSNSWSQSKGAAVNTNRKCRTPSPYSLFGNNLTGPSSSQSGSGFHNNYTDSEKVFNPINNTATTSGNNQPVELHVTNLDLSIGPVEMKKLLSVLFQEHVKVLQVTVFVHSGGGFSAVVKVPSQQDAQYAISQLHRKKIGCRRILISYSRVVSPHDPQIVRSQVITILSAVPGCRLPLFKFREMFESRYLNPISASDLNRLRDVCEIIESPNGRAIVLNSEHRKSPNRLQAPSNEQADSEEPQQQSGEQQQIPMQEQAGFLFCAVHGRLLKYNDNKGWAEQETPALPSVRVALGEFSSRIHALIHTHNNVLPLTSLRDCYEAEFGSLNLDETGVPLEHLVTCVSGIELQVGNSLAKYLCAAPKNKQSSEDTTDDCVKPGTVSPSLIQYLNVFSRELVDLLKTQLHCILSFNKFIPAYHHHFRRQCRVADYGFTRLIDLFEAMPNIIQVMGEGNKRVLTLTHKTQMRRFKTDLLRLLKLQSNRQINIDELPGMFEQFMGKVLNPVDYGLCYVIDLVSQLTENTVTVLKNDGKTYISVPKRDLTSSEIESIKLFAQEVVELMGHSRQYMIAFERFIPAYHHHFGYQCRVSDFGFTKLIELFEAIPQIVKIVDVNGERHVTLTNEKKMLVLSDQVADLVHGMNPPGVPLSGLPAAFQHQYGYALKPSEYDCDSLNQLILELKTVKLVELDSGLTVVPFDQKQLLNVSLCVWRVLMETSKGKMAWTDFEKAYLETYKQKISLEVVRKELQDTVKIIQVKSGNVTVQLTSLQLFARDVYHLLYASDGKLALSSFEQSYLRRFDTKVDPSNYGFSSVIALLQSIPQIVILRGKGAKRLLLLNKVLATAGIKLPPSFIRNNTGKVSSSTGSVEKTGEAYNSTDGAQVLSPSDHLLMNSVAPDNSVNMQHAKQKNIFNLKELHPDFFKTPPHLKNPYLNLFKGCESEEKKDIVVNLPKFDTPPSPCMALVSPCKYLLPASMPTCLLPLPPDPSQLPKVFPFKNNECGEGDADIAEGPSSTSFASPDKEIRDSECSGSGSEGNGTPRNSAARRKLRLAAQFQTPIKFDY